MHNINQLILQFLKTIKLQILTFCWPCISVINQLDAQNFCFTISLFYASTCFEHMRSSSGGQNCITQPLVSSHTYRWPSRARDGHVQFWPPDDEHMCSKHVEAWNKLIVKQKFCASSWLIAEINKITVRIILFPGSFTFATELHTFLKLMSLFYWWHHVSPEDKNVNSCCRGLLFWKLVYLLYI